MTKSSCVCLVLLFLLGCVPAPVVAVPAPVLVLPVQLPTIAPTSTLIIVTPTQAPIYTVERQKIRTIMENYGRVDEKYLSDAYWQRLSLAIDKYGPAQRILTLEFHGDTYNMGSFYIMTPESFETQMRYLLDNDYHFVTGPELVGFLEGWLRLPARSIILTTDSGSGSVNSFARITALFSKLEAEYGVSPHLNSFIWTQDMTPDENYKCPNDSCWQFYRDAVQTGFFTFGTHTETHRDFGTLTYQDTNWDIGESIEEIQDALGLTVYSLSWPFEVCTPYSELMTSLGIRYAFGGYTRDRNQLFAYTADNMSLCLPRLFPPNPNGLSGRPVGLTLEQMLQEATQNVPLK